MISCKLRLCQSEVTLLAQSSSSPSSSLSELPPPEVDEDLEDEDDEESGVAEPVVPFAAKPIDGEPPSGFLKTTNDDFRKTSPYIPAGPLLGSENWMPP